VGDGVRTEELEVVAEVVVPFDQSERERGIVKLFWSEADPWIVSMHGEEEAWELSLRLLHKGRKKRVGELNLFVYPDDNALCVEIHQDGEEGTICLPAYAVGRWIDKVRTLAAPAQVYYDWEPTFNRLLGVT
jgi:hypothetical protein